MGAGIGVLSTGHCHPRVVKAIQDQAAKIIMAQQNILPLSKPMIALLERFERVMPSALTRFLFCNSGSEAVDNAIKIARNATGRQNIIAFEVRPGGVGGGSAAAAQAGGLLSKGPA